MTGRASATAVLVLLVATLVGCGSGSAPGGPVASADPSASMPVLGEAELAVCDGTVRMSEGVTRLRSVRVRRGAGNSLGGALDLVLEGQRLVEEYAPSRMRTRVRTLGFAVTNVVIAVEDFRTTDRQQAAASNIRRRTNALGHGIEGFREWVGCPDPEGRAGARATSTEATPGS